MRKFEEWGKERRDWKMKKGMRRTAAAGIAAAMILAQCPVAWAAGNEPGAEREYGAQTEAPVNTERVSVVEDVYVNPLYEGEISEADLQTVPEDAGGEISLYSEPVYADTIEEAGAQIREGMKLRNETIEVYYQAPEYVDGVMREIAAAGLEHTGVPDEGDYLKWQYAGWSGKGNLEYSSEDEMCYMTFTYTYTYYTDYEQEREVDERLEDVLDELAVYDSTDYSKLQAVYSFICENTEYDYEHLGDSDYKLQYTAYAALLDQKAVCQGYAVLFYRMALELGVDSRLISGTGNGEAHGWNIAAVDGLYYNVDATWDAGNTEYQYFLKGSEHFTDHEADEEFMTEEFTGAYPISAEDYQPEEPGGQDDPEQPEEILVEAPAVTSVYSQAQTSAKVTWTRSEQADGYELYRAETPDTPAEEWILTKTINAGDTLQYTNQGLTLGQTYYYKVRAFALDENQERVYSDFSNVSYMPATVTFSGPYSNSSQRIRLLWNPVQGAHGYQLWRKNVDGTYSVVKTLGDRGNVQTEDQGAVSAYSNTGLTAGETYTYRIRAFAFVNGEKVFGVYSDEISVTVMPEKPILTVSSPKDGRVLLDWNAVNGAEGYQIWRAESGTGNYAIAKTMKEGGITTYTNTGLAGGKVYDYKIRAYTEKDGKTTFGEYSAVQSIRVK